jgi:hypothetical protein
MDEGTALEEVVKVVEVSEFNKHSHRQIFKVTGSLGGKFTKKHASTGTVISYIGSQFNFIVVVPTPSFEDWYAAIRDSPACGISSTASVGDKLSKKKLYNPRYSFPLQGPYTVHLGSFSVTVRNQNSLNLLFVQILIISIL